MKAEQNNTAKQDTNDAVLALEFCDLEQICADAMLDQVDTAQQHIQDIQTDIALLHTMENALDMLTENMAKVSRLAKDALQSETDHTDMGRISDEILNLLMVNTLIVEDTEFNGHRLFMNNVISMGSFPVGELTLTTTNIPEITGTETGDFQAMLDDMDNIARVINRQYQRIGTVMRILLDTYEQVQSEVNLLLNAQTRVFN
jgi:flagellin-like hook-associated protein FlgL